MNLGMVSIIPDEFTNAEKERINQLYGNDFEDIKPEDATLIARFEARKARVEEQFQAEIAAFEAESKARIENSREMHEQAMSNLQEMHDAAMERLKAVENGI